CADPTAFDGEPGVELVLRAGAAVGAPDLAAASLLRRRQTSRLRYSPRAPEAAALEALAAAAREAGLELHLVGQDAPARCSLGAGRSGSVPSASRRGAS